MPRSYTFWVFSKGAPYFPPNWYTFCSDDTVGRRNWCDETGCGVRPREVKAKEAKRLQAFRDDAPGGAPHPAAQTALKAIRAGALASAPTALLRHTRRYR